MRRSSGAVVAHLIAVIIHIYVVIFTFSLQLQIKARDQPHAVPECIGVDLTRILGGRMAGLTIKVLL